MRWDEVCSHPPAVVRAEDRTAWAEQGYLWFPGLIPESEIAPLRDALGAVIEHSRSLSESTHRIDLDVGHSAAEPRLRRAADVDDVHEAFWAFCSQSVLVDIAADILGPNVRFREAYANLKWSRGGAAVAWHQDLAFYPHTNTGTCQFIVALDDVTDDRGPLTVVPGSNRGPAFSHYTDDGRWIGSIPDAALARIDLSEAVALTGPAGSVSVHHGLTLHSSAPNFSNTSRPVLVITYTAADSIPYTASPYRSSHHGVLVRGVEPGVAHHEELTLILPPDWSEGYTSLFDHQAQEPETS